MPIRVLLLAALAAPIAFAQTPVPSPEAASTAIPLFDVISVKPDKTGGGMTSLQLTPDGFIAENVLVHMLLTESYQLNEDQVINEPAWTKSDHFDIRAKVAGPDAAALGKLNFNLRRSMFKQILAEQFKMATHNETRQLPVFNVTVQKGGLKFKETQPDPKHPIADNGQGYFEVRHGKIVMRGATMAYFLSFLSHEVGRTLIDKTGLTGKYDLTLQWTPDDRPAPMLNGVPDPNAPPGIFTAIQEQLGLKLESSKGPVPVLVIDHIEKPAEN